MAISASLLSNAVNPKLLSRCPRKAAAAHGLNTENLERLMEAKGK